MSYQEWLYRYYLAAFLTMGVGIECAVKVARALSGWLGGCGC